MNNEFLIRRAKKDDKDAFCRLMDEHLQCMYKMASAYLKNDEDVADAIQDTILSCYENLRSLKQNRYFKTWMPFHVHFYFAILKALGEKVD